MGQMAVKPLEIFKEPDAVLLLEDGTEFPGFWFGARQSLKQPDEGSSSLFGFGEVIFNTAMCGYQEVLTDPSYWQQLVVMTYPHQGNYGIHKDDSESKGGPKVAGFIIRDEAISPSSSAAVSSLRDYLSQNNIPAISGIDTRALTLHIRDKGAMRGLLLTKVERTKMGRAFDIFKGYPSFVGRDLICEVTTKEPYQFEDTKIKATVKSTKKVVAFDFGVKLNLLREIAKRGAQVLVVPANTTAEQVLAETPDGIFLSNGPGDPAAAQYAIDTVKKLLGKKPIFGVCMGHQILGLALGARTFKMKFGHRGVNQPVLDLSSRKVEISSHNHGFAVDASSLPSNVKLTHRNLNDEVCEGLECSELKAFSVQYHPESAPGPHDSDHLFDRFFHLMGD